MLSPQTPPSEPRIGPVGPWRFVSDQRVGSIERIELRELALARDAATIHDWVRRDYARYWGMQGMTCADVRAAYEALTARPSLRALIGLVRGADGSPRPAFLTECYLPICEAFARHYDARDSDRGLHILVAPRPAQPIPGFTRAAFASVLELLFADPAAERIVVEPDIRNHKIRAINRAFGFRELRPIEIEASPAGPAKTAMLSVCTREDLRRAMETLP